MKWPVLVVSMIRARERRAHMRETFSSESLIFIPGYDPSGETRQNFIDTNILHKSRLDKGPTMGEIGCALGHRRAWQWAIDRLVSDRDKVIILEDDTEPTDNYIMDLQKSIEIQGGLYENAEVTFLCHHGGFGCPRKITHDDGRWKSGTGNYGYVITKKGARMAIEKQFPMKTACDRQWRDSTYMYVIDKPIVTQSSIGRHSQIGERG
jgi:GR25 family glycosyltransferase involved in LPS biosynthesis